MDQKPAINYPSQFAFLLGFFGVCIILAGIVVGFIGARVLHVDFKQVPAELNKMENANLSRLLNTLASFLCFFLPTFILARILSKKPFAQIGFNSVIGWKQLLLVLAVTLPSIMLSGALGELNHWIPLPADLYNEAKKLEEEYKQTMMVMAAMHSPIDYIIALLVIAAAPAFFEEVLFRGGFQQVFVGWTKSKWTGIIITSILFSAVHFSYFGFLYRAGLGIILGLIFYYSRNIWLNIFLHFLNNAVVVTQLYILTREGKLNEKTMDEGVPVWWGLFALILLMILFRAFKKESNKLIADRQSMMHSSPENIPS